jgi:glycosyltransferase involved in cell wall biosynthesis
MAPLEIAAAGRPTIAYRAGGAVETILEEITGVFFDRQTPSDLAAAILRFERMDWRADVLSAHASKFGIDVFQNSFRRFLNRVGCSVAEHETPAILASASRPLGVSLKDVDGRLPA